MLSAKQQGEDGETPYCRIIFLGTDDVSDENFVQALNIIARQIAPCTSTPLLPTAARCWP
jgi:hypothetical protein